MLLDLLSLRVSEMMRYHHVSSLMDDHDQIGTCLVHLSPDPTNVGSRASDLTVQIHSLCVETLNGPIVILHETLCDLMVCDYSTPPLEGSPSSILISSPSHYV